MATAWTTGAAILAHVGVASPTAADTAWATSCASAVCSAIEWKIGRAGTASPSDEWSELSRAALQAGAYAYRQRNAPEGVATFADLDGAAIRLARDALDTIRPIVERYSVPGIA